MSTANRDFLLQRLVRDSQSNSPGILNLSGRNEDVKQEMSESHSTRSENDLKSNSISPSEKSSISTFNSNESCDGNQTESKNPTIYNNAFMAALMGSYHQMANPYLAASLAAASSSMPSASNMPLLYPSLYQSFMSNLTNIEGIQKAMIMKHSHESSRSSPSSTPSLKRQTPPFYGNQNDLGQRPSPNNNNELLRSLITKSVPVKSSENSQGSRKRPATSNKKSPVHSDGSPSNKKIRAVKKLVFDEETASPVSGMFITPATAVAPQAELQAAADSQQQLDESAKFVIITEEAKAELATITNVIGDYVCRLCKVRYEDAFRLAQHKCPRIQHEEYRCPECDKIFSCPANLASHRRWHKPREGDINVSVKNINNNTNDAKLIDLKYDLPTQVISADQPLNLTHHKSALQIALGAH